MDTKQKTLKSKRKSLGTLDTWEQAESESDFYRKLDALQQRVDELQRWATDSRARPQASLDEAVEELDVALAELQLAEEELCQQNEDLVTTRETAEVERRRYQELFDFAPDGYLVTDAVGIIQEANRATAALLNTPQDFLVGKPLTVFIAEGERKAFRTQLSQLLETRAVEEWEGRVQPYRAVPFDAALTVAAVLDLEGKVVGLRWLLRDITERKRMERALREEAAISSALARVGQELISLLDTPVILERLCQLTAEMLEADCSYTILRQPQEEAYRVAASSGDPPEQREALRTLQIPGKAISGLLARMASAEVVELDLETPQRSETEALLQPFGMTAALSLGLWRGKELIGLQTAGYRGRKGFSTCQKRIARGISQLASLALANAKLLIIGTAGRTRLGRK